VLIVCGSGHGLINIGLLSQYLPDGTGRGMREREKNFKTLGHGSWSVAEISSQYLENTKQGYHPLDYSIH